MFWGPFYKCDEKLAFSFWWILSFPQKREAALFYGVAFLKMIYATEQKKLKHCTYNRLFDMGNSFIKKITLNHYCLQAHYKVRSGSAFINLNFFIWILSLKYDFYPQIYAIFFRKSNIWVEYSHDISLLPFWYFLCKDFQSKFALSQLTLKQYIFKSDCLSTKKNSSKIKMGLKLCHLFTVIVHFLIRSRARMLPLKIIYFF